MKQGLRILTCDASLSCTGLCLMLLDSGKYKTLPLTIRLDAVIAAKLKNKTAFDGEKHVYIADWQVCQITQLVHKMAHRIDLFILEDYAFQANTSNLTALAELAGCIRLAAYRQRLPIVMITQSTWKKITYGNGHMKKPEVHEAAIAKWPAMASKTQDEIDAYSMAVAVRTIVRDRIHGSVYDQIMRIDSSFIQ